MIIEFKAKVFFWKGPAPWYFVKVPPKSAKEIKAVESRVTYGWGMIPATVRIGNTEWYTALWPKDGSYVVPLKAVIRKAEKLEEGDTIVTRIEIHGVD